MSTTRETKQYPQFCKTCKCTKPHHCDTWESSDGGHEDYKYTCTTCGTYFWVDGIDS